MKRLVAFINEDQILKYLLWGILGPVGIFIISILSAYLGIPINFGGASTYLFYAFIVSIVSLVIYIPFFKKTKTSKSKETKTLIFFWILLSTIVCLVWARINSFTPSFNSLDGLSIIFFAAGAVLLVIGIPFLILNYIVKKSSPQKRQAVFFSICSAIIASLITAGLMYTLKQNKTSIQVYTMDLKGKSSFSCSTKMGTTLFPKPDYENKVFKTVDGALFTDDKTKMAIEIDGKELKMITATAVEAGMTEPARLNILRDNDSELIAIDLQQDIAIDPGAGTFLLNKKTGTAVWSKSKPAFIGSALPDTQAYFMECR